MKKIVWLLSYLCILFCNSLMSQEASIADPQNSTIDFPYQNALINNTTPVLVGFLKDANNNPISDQSILIKIDGTVLASVTSKSDGEWDYTLSLSQALAEGPHVLAIFIDGGVSAFQTQPFAIDITPPLAPIITFPVNGLTIFSNLVHVTGTTESYATVTLFVDGEAYGQPTASDANGNWSVDIVLDSDIHSIAAQAQDIAFNIGPRTEPLLITIIA